MADRPILFSAPMVKALLDGRKTQTRRVMNLSGHKSYIQFGPSDTKGYDWHFRDAAMRWHDLRDAELKAKLRFAVGDRLYVREAWRAPRKWDDVPPRELPGLPICYESAPFEARTGLDVGRLRPGMHMPRWASRLTLLVTDVRVQRLQDCSEADAIAEGVEKTGLSNEEVWKNYSPEENIGRGFLYPSNSYRTLWDSINGPGSWAANPWVVAISFTVHQMNIDAMEVAHASS